MQRFLTSHEAFLDYCILWLHTSISRVDDTTSWRALSLQILKHGKLLRLIMDGAIFFQAIAMMLRLAGNLLFPFTVV